MAWHGVERCQLNATQYKKLCYSNVHGGQRHIANDERSHFLQQKSIPESETLMGNEMRRCNMRTVDGPTRR